ncbi:hypothetical protein CHX26_09610 [Porphyrobacter sp. HT-58-2]|nr:hypothetical protein CHX26_09610 [Porphyrobacter sp. HT-58-2]
MERVIDLVRTRRLSARSPSGVRQGHKDKAMKGDLTGGCLCVAVRYSLREGFRFRPYACHCTDCQTRTGAAFNEHMLFARQDLEIEGELDSGSYEQPSGAVSTIWGCAKCKVRIFAENDKRPGFASLRCGTLDRSAEIVPVVSPAVV